MLLFIGAMAGLAATVGTPADPRDRAAGSGPAPGFGSPERTVDTAGFAFPTASVDPNTPTTTPRPVFETTSTSTSTTTTSTTTTTTTTLPEPLPPAVPVIPDFASITSACGVLETVRSVQTLFLVQNVPGERAVPRTTPADPVEVQLYMTRLELAMGAYQRVAPVVIKADIATLAAGVTDMRRALQESGWITTAQPVLAVHLRLASQTESGFGRSLDRIQIWTKANCTR